jgi:hypothetical protein
VAGSETVVFIIANRSDLPPAVPDTDTEGIEFARNQDSEWFATSALTGNGVTEAFDALAERIAARKPVALQGANGAQSARRLCC